MSFPLQITFTNVEPSPAVKDRIAEEAADLEKFFPRIVRGRVAVSAPHRHRQRGFDYHISLHLEIPGVDVVVNHDSSTAKPDLETGLEGKADQRQNDIYICVREAFLAARQQLEKRSEKLDSRSRGSKLLQEP